MSVGTLSRRALLGAGIAAGATSLLAAEPAADIAFAQDFDECWRTLGERYCYFSEKRTDWARVRQLYRPRALAASDRAQLGDVIGSMLNELYDAHTHLADPADGAPRWPPYDLLVEPAGEAARIVAVRADSVAADAGLTIGAQIVSVEGRPFAAAMAAAMPRCLARRDPVAEAYAANVVVAGRRRRERILTVLTTGRPHDVLLPLTVKPASRDREYSRLPGGIGLIVIRSFGDTGTIAAFDAALLALRDAPGLVIDVRDNGGGDTAVARPIMGRFITERRRYAYMRRRDGQGLGERWSEYVDPRGPFTYAAPVVVLTGRWSGSMAEGFPMGMRGIGRATIVGTPMMGLGAAVLPLTLDRTGLRLQYSGEPVYDSEDRARSAMRPDVLVPDGADALAAGLALLRRTA